MIVRDYSRCEIFSALYFFSEVQLTHAIPRERERGERGYSEREREESKRGRKRGKRERRSGEREREREMLFTTQHLSHLTRTNRKQT